MFHQKSFQPIMYYRVWPKSDFLGNGVIAYLNMRTNNGHRIYAIMASHFRAVGSRGGGGNHPQKFYQKLNEDFSRIILFC